MWIFAGWLHGVWLSNGLRVELETSRNIALCLIFFYLESSLKMGCGLADGLWLGAMGLLWLGYATFHDLNEANWLDGCLNL